MNTMFFAAVEDGKGWQALKHLPLENKSNGRMIFKLRALKIFKDKITMRSHKYHIHLGLILYN